MIVSIGKYIIEYKRKDKKEEQLSEWLKEAITASIEEGYRDGKVYSNRKKVEAEWILVAEITNEEDDKDNMD